MLAPVYVSSGATLVILVVETAIAPFSGFGSDVFEWLSVVALSTVPLSFLGGLMRTRLARSAVAELMTELGEPPAPGSLRQALARALGDPSLELAYWVRDGTYVDVDGHVVALPAEGSARVATAVERSGRPVAAIVHDASLRDHPELVDAVVAAAGLALENERLQAELRARLEELRASRFRLVETADVERRRLERNLHDGAQQRLVALSLSLALAEREFASDPAVIELLERTRSDLADALAELRELARGIHPSLLTDRGLKAALEALANRALVPVELAGLPDERLPDGVEAAAYYLVAEALTNVAKYARASMASVRVVRENGHVIVEVSDDGIGGADSRRGSGLRGLADRVEALDGRLDLRQPAGCRDPHPGGDPLRAHGRARLPAARRPPARTLAGGPHAHQPRQATVATIVLRQHVDYQQWGGRCRCHAQTSSEDRGLSGRRQFVRARRAVVARSSPSADEASLVVDTVRRPVRA